MQPRRKQKPITIRSDRAAARLKLLTRDGRSQAEVIEDALERMAPPPLKGKDKEEWLARLDALVAKVPKDAIMTMKEFDAIEYDEFGDPR
ncbi:MAG: hypothetical protein ACFBQW_08255 [Sphingomonadaceae bacterium]